ncbi:hypothetical protein ACO0E1_18660 [Curtobacterium sp. RRHDQ66]|uniref:hypothetical protein n=1 Tax=Curtobacterium guangdongense TaxID=3413380 RepID=UPI003BF2DD46
MNSRQVIAAAIAVVALPLLTACGGSPADPVASAREMAVAPAWVRQPAGTDCGQVEVSHLGELPKEARRCLDRVAANGQRGTLAFIRWTTEGDPGVSFILVDGSTVKVASILAFDSNGGDDNGWSEQTCTDVAALPDCR